MRRAQRLRPPRLAEAPIVLLRGQSRMGLAAVLGAALGLGLLGGFFFAASPLLVAGGLLGALAVAAVVADPRLGLWGAVLVIALLPFGVLPLPSARPSSSGSCESSSPPEGACTSRLLARWCWSSSPSRR